ncbi:MAG: hypothetical protein HN403_17905 [Rhodospirillales bacterium]|jgi:hypothetical protein|nr:hypothetical protein [Rhodospirillales bacterium]
MIVDELNQAEKDTLRDIVENDRLRSAIPTEHLEKLIDLGYAEQRNSGVIATGKARVLFRGLGRP